MTHVVRVRRKARADLEEASRWYEAQSPGLGGQFLDEVQRTFALVSAQPSLYADIYRGTRRAMLQRFPFGVYYRVIGEAVSVVAVMHSSRHPRQWMRRT